MTERFLTKKDIAAMFGTTPGVAASVLAEHGIYPVDFGYGRSRGRRWLESTVKQAMLEMYQAAQPKPKTAKNKRPTPLKHSITQMSVNDLLMLTHGQCVQ